MASEPTTLGERLAFARKLARLDGDILSARGLAHLADLATSQVAHLESGVRENPKEETLIKLVAALGISLDWLCLGKGDPPLPADVQRAVDKAAIRRRAAEALTAGS